MDMNTGEFGYGLFMLPSIHCSRSIVVRICSAGDPPCFQPFRCRSPWLGELQLCTRPEACVQRRGELLASKRTEPQLGLRVPEALQMDLSLCRQSKQPLHMNWKSMGSRDTRLQLLLNAQSPRKHRGIHSAVLRRLRQREGGRGGRLLGSRVFHGTVAQDVAFARLACAFFSVILARVLRIFEVDWERNLAPHPLSTRLLPMPLLLFLPVPLPLPCPLSPSFDQQRNED
uniref:Uncharacterized protein n=1 Tax=Toxoplasma gondii COUG TaxID=1074873 RepID=A0A2G8XY49_TOXGO|nr:hypothetical protein TGCOUG_220125 [Toxoplasma gondii COUG]